MYDNCFTQLALDGYCAIPDAVSPVLVGDALRTINTELYRTQCSDFYRDYSLMEKTGFNTAITCLFSDSLLPELITDLLDTDTSYEVDRGQIALEFPSEGSLRSAWHLDGFYDSKHGAISEPVNFPVIIGVFLSDVSQPKSGNLMVVPQGHLTICESVAQYGLEEAMTVWDKLVAKPQPITATPGTAVIMHHLLPHFVSRNTSPDVRYAVYFRPYVKSRPRFESRILTDPYFEWPGVHPYLDAKWEKKSNGVV